MPSTATTPPPVNSAQPAANPSTSPSRANPHGPASLLSASLLQGRQALRDTMRDKINVVDYDKFIKDFLPSCSIVHEHNIFHDPPSFKIEKDMYEWFTNKLNKSNLGKRGQWLFVSNPYKSDPNDTTGQAVDCGLYPKKFAPDLSETAADKNDVQNRRVDWSRIDLPIECKVHSEEQDPFDDNHPKGEVLGEKRVLVLGQILSYAELVFKHQQRQFLYMILFLGRCARIVRFDRSGLYATKKFDYQKEGGKLTTFFKHYVGLEPAQRGYDMTAYRIEPNSPLAKKMRRLRDEAAKIDSEDHVLQLFSQSLDDGWAWWRLEVHVVKAAADHPEQNGRAPPGTETRRFLVGKPHFQATAVPGRGTRGYVAVAVSKKGQLLDHKGRSLFTASGKLDALAWDEAHKLGKQAVSSCFVYLKDAWRVDHFGIEQEGSVLKLLMDAGVRFIPTLVCHGDLKGQVTTSQAVWKKDHAGKEDDCPMKQHQHYRLVVEEVGKPLDQCENGRQLVEAVGCAMVAHQAAYLDANLIHRDISSGNILLHRTVNGWVGLLNDWELSKKIGIQDAKARQPDRTGTWQFTSAHALDDPCREIVLQDEIESFLHVLLYIAVRFLPNNIKPHTIGQFQVDYFDGYFLHPDGYRCGNHKLNAMTTGTISLRNYNLAADSLEFHIPADTSFSQKRKHPINKIFVTLLSWIAAYYSLDQMNVSAEDEDNISAIHSDSSPSVALLWGQTSSAHSLASDSSDSESDSEGPARALPPRKIEKLARKLSQHSYAIELLRNAITSKTWPKKDKGEDMRPTKGVIPTNQRVLAVGTTNTNSKKRPLDDAQPQPSSPKRSKA